VRIAEGRVLMAMLAEGARVDEWELVPAGEDRYQMKGGLLHGETVVFSEDAETGMLGFRGGGYSGAREQGRE